MSRIQELGSRVHVWTTDPGAVSDPELLQAYDRLMTDEERARNRRFRPDRSKREHLVTRALVRTVLSRYADVAPEDWRFVPNEHGRPEIAPAFGASLRFNVSHTSGLIACAVTQGREVGVDVEAIDRRGKTVEIADRFFSASEVTALHALPEDRRLERFFVYWTLKEAYIKARGMGLALPLDQFSFHIEDERLPRISFDPRLDDDPSSWQFETFRPTARHFLAVGLRRGAGADAQIDVCPIIPLVGSASD